ncbi:MAG TPA: phage tail protein I [Sulfurovum sp. UBA12169]|nr:MAG TPA: phage tail protein I [Sulfurovum sp. UBA12169]
MQPQILSLLPSFEPKELHALSHISNDTRQQLSTEIQEIKKLRDPLLCNARFLQFLAYAHKADLWTDVLHDDEKRQLILQSKNLHRHKGTVWAVLEILKAIGLSSASQEAILLEYKDREKAKYTVKRDGTYSYDATVLHNDGSPIYPLEFTHWTEFIVELKVPLTSVKAELARKLIEMYKPVRSKLLGFVYDTLQARDGSIYYNAEHTHGLIN